MPITAASARRAAIGALLLPLAACAHQPRVVALDAPPAPPVRVAAAALPAGPSPINAGLSAAGTVWHLRAALNVAALACRGPGDGAMATGYNALLTAQKPALAAAQARFAAEYRAAGGDWQGRYDEAMTRLYNFFSDSNARARFCAAAGAILAETQALPPGAMPAFAAARLPVLDAAIVGTGAEPALPAPVLALASAPAPARPTQRPRLELDLSALPPD